MRKKLLGIINVDSDATGRLLIIYSAFVKYLRKNRNTMNQCIRMRWAGHVARMGDGRGVHRVLVGKPEGKRPLGRPRRRW
jgi:hypothetical protein